MNPEPFSSRDPGPPTKPFAARQLPDGFERRSVAAPPDRERGAPDGVGAGGGRELDVVTFGPEDAPALVFHSGTPSGPGAHQALADAALTCGLRYVHYGRPGYGRSTPRYGRSVADAVPDTLAVLDELGHDEFVALGWSGGGPHALACGALAPGRCRGVGVLAGVAPSDVDGFSWTEGMGTENLVEFDLARAGGETFEAFLTGASEAMVEATVDDLGEAMGDLVTERDLATISGSFGRYLVDSGARAFERGVEGWRDDDLAFLSGWGFSVREVGVPVFLYQGSEDRMVPLAHGEWLASHLPTAHFERLEGEGHLSIWQAAVPSIVDSLRATLS